MAKQISSLSILVSLSGEGVSRGTQQITGKLRGFNARVTSLGGGVKGLSGGLSGLAGRMGIATGALGAIAAPLAAATAGFFAAKAAVASLGEAFQRVDAAAKFADRVGTTSKAIQALGLAAERGGASAGTMETSLQRMTRRVAEAAQGSGEAVNALAELGLEAEALTKLTPDQQMVRIARAMDEVSNQGDRVRLAMKLFDTEGVALLTTLKGLADTGMEPLIDEMTALGALSREDAAAIESMNDRWTEFNKAIDGVWNQIAAALAPVLEDLLTHLLIPMAKAVIDLVKGFRQLMGVSVDQISGSMDESAKATEAAAAATSTWAAEQKRLAEEAKKVEAAQKAAAAEAKRAAAEAERVIDSLKTPFEKLNEETMKFGELLGRGLIPIRFAERGIKSIAERLIEAEKKALGLSDAAKSIRTPTVGAVELDSTAGFNVVQKLTMQAQDTERERRAAEREAARDRKKLIETMKDVREAVIDSAASREPIRIESTTIVG